MTNAERFICNGKYLRKAKTFSHSTWLYVSGLSELEAIIYLDVIGILFSTEGLESGKQKLKVYLFTSWKVNIFSGLSYTVHRNVFSVIRCQALNIPGEAFHVGDLPIRTWSVVSTC